MNDVNEMVTILASQIRPRYKDTAIVPILRGGMVPAGLLADKLNLRNMGVVVAEHYDGTERRDEVQIHTVLIAEDTPEVIIVDDIVDSGKTLRLVVNEVTQIVDEVRTAALVVRSGAAYEPDYYVIKELKEDYITMPWHGSDSEIKCMYRDKCPYPWQNAVRCNDPLVHENCSIFIKKSMGNYDFTINKESRGGQP